MINKKRTSKAFMFIILACALMACNNPPGGQEGARRATVKIAKLLYISYGPHFIAMEEGYFADQGLQIEFVKVPSSTDAIPLLVRGQLDVYSGVINLGILNAIGRGADIRIVAGKAFLDPRGCPSQALVVRHGLFETHGLGSPAELRGRRVSLNRNSVEGFYVEKLLHTSGLTLDDIEITLNPPSVDFEALAQNSIDLTAISEPWVTRIVESGHGYVWKPAYEILPDFQWSYVLYGPTFLAGNRELGRRFMIAYLKGVRQFNQGSTARNVEILAKHTGLDPALLKRACWPVLRNDGSINADSILEFQSWGLERGMVDQALSVSRIWDPGFAEYASEFLNRSR